MINLGDKVKDPVTGFIGIAVARHSYLQGCDRITVQPSVDKTGKLMEEAAFDEPQLDLLKQAAVTRKSGLTADAKPGGPDKFTDIRRF